MNDTTLDVEVDRTRRKTNKRFNNRQTWQPAQRWGVGQKKKQEARNKNEEKIICGVDSGLYIFAHGGRRSGAHLK